MIKNGYGVSAVGKELESINDVEGDIDVIDLCINPAKGLKLIKECKRFQDRCYTTRSRKPRIDKLSERKRY